MAQALPVFCDWLKISDAGFTYQPEAWRAQILRTNGKAVEWERRAWVQHRHSSSSSTIRARFLETGCVDSDGRQHGQLAIDGNLGRFGGANNLFGVHVADSAERVLGLLGQSTDTYFANPRRAGLRRVDLTCNFAFGSAADAFAYLAWAGQHRIGRAVATAYPTGCSWVTENWSAKVYDKLADLRRHKLGDLADELFAREGHVLRLELTLRTDELNRLRVGTLERWSTDMENVIFTERFAPILRGESLPTLDELAENLPARLAANLHAWRNGMDFQAAMRDGRISRRTYYRLRAELLHHGVDIAERCEVHTLAIRPRLVEMRPLAEPEWLKAA